MGMLRTLILFGAGFALMPSPPPGDEAAKPGLDPGPFAYMAAAAEAVADMRSFCQRNPNLCSTAGSVANQVEGKAKYSAKLIYEWANESTAEIAPAETAELKPKFKGRQNTLTVADLAEPWREPKKPKG
jgi:hypothetical protein